MKKILIIGMSSTVGGVENYILNLYEKIDKNDIQIDFLTTEKFEGFYYDKLVKEHNANVYNIPSIKKHFFKSVKAIKKIVEVNKYDVIHINLCSAQLFLYARVFKHYYNKTKIITHSHSSGETSVERKILHYVIRPMLIRNTSYYIACSKVAGEWMFKKKISDSDNLIVMKNAIDTDRFNYDINKRNVFRKKQGYKNNFVIGHVGRFEKVKNHEFIINLFSKYVRINPKARLLLVGDGSTKDSIINMIKNYELDKYVKILDITANIENIYQGIDAFVMPSFFEGLPLVGIEAQTAGLPCIFSKNVTREIKLTDNVFFEDLDIDKWVEKLQLIESDKIKNRNGKKTDIIKSGFDISTEAQKIKKMYLEV